MIESRPAEAVSAWRRAIAAGNSHFERGEDRLAVDCYQRARELALHPDTRWPCANDGVDALVVSYLNLAEAALRIGRPDEACHLTCALHRSLVEAVGSVALPERLRAVARSHLRRTIAALIRLQDRLGPRPCVTRLLCHSGFVDGTVTRH